jgi:hypothetical protein
MSLLNLAIGRNVGRTLGRSPKAFRPRLQPYLEGLEQRTVLSGGGGAASVAAAVTSPVTITGINITNLAVTDANHLLATFNLTGTLNTVTGSTPFTLHNLQLPITLNSVGATSDGCPILHLSLQIPDLDILGLHVRLDNCNNGPVTVDVTAIPSPLPGGGVLGDLLCSVDNLLSGSGGLLNLGGLTGQVTSGLTQVLNGILTDLTTGSNAGTGGTIGPSTGSTDTIPAGDCELVNLHLGPINANVLGLQITTSQICLNVFADPNGGLLGSLLCSLDNLLSNPATATAQNALVTNILRDLGRLGL